MKAISWWRVMGWSLRRELWESRSLYLAPLAVAPVALVGFLISVAGLPAKIRSLPPMQQHDVIRTPYDFSAGLIMIATLIVSVFYCLDALYGERRDRSILFWKSLPVSDRTTVLAKAIIPIFILPLITFAVTVVLHLIMALIGSVVLAASGLSVAAFWSQLSFPHMSVLLLYHLVTVHGLSWAPFFGWMLLVSAWSRRAPFVWALLPPLALGVMERIAFNTTWFASMLQARLGGAGSVTMGAPGMMPMDPMTTQMTPGRFLTEPGLWIGFVLTAIFIAAAVRLRRDRAPS